MAKYCEYLKEAYDKGCRWDFETQEFVSFTGNRRRVKLYGTQRYQSIAITCKKCFPLHKFIAFQLYGEESFKPGVHVRHLDGNVYNLSRENIVLGSASENEGDKPTEVKSRTAKVARAAQPKRMNAKLTETQVKEIRREYEVLLGEFPGKKKLPNGTTSRLSNKYGISRTNLYDIVKGKIWNDV